VTIVDLRGRCTLGEETELLGRDLKKLIDGGCRKILLNLTELLQIDSTGVSTIVATYVSLRRLKGEVKLLHPTGRVQTVLEITHMLQVIPNFEDEAKAIASFSSRTYTAKS
jgi:anti-anti-sigma factor